MKATSTLALELTVAGQTTKFESSESSIIVGRSKSCTVTIPKNDVVSREHLKVEQKEGDIWLTDLGSSNGTYYRGSKLMPHVECLYTGDSFYLGAKSDGYGMKITYVSAGVVKETTPASEGTVGERTVALNLPDIYSFRDEEQAKVELESVVDQLKSNKKLQQTQASIVRKPEPKSQTQASVAIPPAMKEGTKASLIRVPVQPVQTKKDSTSTIRAKVVDTASRDEHLMQMQMIEAELAVLVAKKENLAREIVELGKKELEYKAMEQKYQTEKAELERIAYDHSEKESKLKDVIRDLEEKVPELINKTEILSMTESKLNEKLELVAAADTKIKAAEARLKEASEKLELAIEEAQAKKSETTFFDSKVKHLVGEEDRLHKVKFAHEHKIAELETSIADLETQKNESEQAYHDQTAQENALIEKLIAEREIVDAQLKQAMTDYERVQKKTKFELESLDAESKLKKTVLEREVEEIVTRKTIVLRDVEEAKRGITETQAKLDALNYTVQTEQSRLVALRKDIQKADAEKAHHDERVKALIQKYNGIDQEVERLLSEAKEKAKAIKLEAEKSGEAKQQEWTARFHELEKDYEVDRKAWAAKSAELEKAYESEKRVWDAKVLEVERDFETKRKAWDVQELALQKDRENERKVWDNRGAAIEKEHAERVKVLDQAALNIENEHAARIKSLDNVAASIEKNHAVRKQELENFARSIEKEHLEHKKLLEAKAIAIEEENNERKQSLARDFEEARRRAAAEHEATLVALKENEVQAKLKQAEDFRMWVADEEARVKRIAAKNANEFAHHVSMRTLADLPSSGSVSVSTLIEILENKLVEGLSGQVLGEGIYDPNFNKGVRKFWIQASAGVATLVALVLGGYYGPQFLGKKLEVLKVANQQADAKFMEEIKHERERMLALHLEARDTFQESYVDNILYNPGYLTMKREAELQKSWTVQLSKFFFETLLFDDRKVVSFMPIESSLITELDETYKVLNSQNFDVNLVKMKKLEEAKLEEMWLLVGGRDNWLKVRKKEAEFYTVHARSSAKTGRTPTGK